MCLRFVLYQVQRLSLAISVVAVEKEAARQVHHQDLQALQALQAVGQEALQADLQEDQVADITTNPRVDHNLHQAVTVVAVDHLQAVMVVAVEDLATFSRKLS